MGLTEFGCRVLPFDERFGLPFSQLIETPQEVQTSIASLTK